MSSKTYYNAFYKRVAQHYLLSHVSINNTHNNHITGLAGDNPTEYKQVLTSHFNPKTITLCDKDKYLPDVIHDDILNLPVTNVMDLDFECSYINGGELAVDIFNRWRYAKLSKGRPISKYFMLTFSLRYAGYDKTIGFINKNFYDDTLNIAGKETIISGNGELGCGGYVKNIIHSQNIFKESVMVQYADTSHMLSLVVKL